MKLRPLQLFLLFARIALLGFGGVLPWAHRILVERRRLLTPAEFAELFALAQLLPGPTICNLAMLYARREAGTRGAVAALCGMLALPVLIVCALVALMQSAGTLPAVAGAIRGMSAVAAGLVLGMGVKLARTLPRTWQHMVLAAAMGLGVVVWHAPLLLMLALLTPLGMWLLRRTAR